MKGGGVEKRYCGHSRKIVVMELRADIGEEGGRIYLPETSEGHKKTGLL